MEYRRRRRNGKSKPRRRGNGTGKAGSQAASALISLVLIGCIVYLVVSSNAGEWIAQNVMAPLFTAASGWGKDDPVDTDAPLSQTPDQSAGLPGGGIPSSLDLSGESAEPVSAQASLPAMRCAMLQMGVFSSLDNAQSEAAALQAKGAGGYIVKDSSTGETRYRVMAAGYDTEEEARIVKERLAGDGVDSALFLMEAPAATFKVTADEEAIAGVQSAFAAFGTVQSALTQAALSFDADKMEVASGKARAAEILARFEGDMAGLSTYQGATGAVGMMLGAYSSARDQLLTLSGGEYESTVDFSAAMKYTQLYVTDQYAALIGELAQ